LVNSKSKKVGAAVPELSTRHVYFCYFFFAPKKKYIQTAKEKVNIKNLSNKFYKHPLKLRRKNF